MEGYKLTIEETPGLPVTEVSSEESVDSIKTLEPVGQRTESVPTGFLASCRRSFNTMMQMATMATILSGAVGETQAHENKDEDPLKRMEDLGRIESICREHGFDLEDNPSAVVSVDLPKGEVKKIIVHIGQVHAIGDYKKVSRKDRNEIVDAQEEIFHLLSGAHEKTGVPQICLSEGLAIDADVQVLLNNEDTHGMFRDSVVGIASNLSKNIKEAVDYEIEMIDQYTAGNKAERSSTLFDMSRAARKAMTEEGLDDAVKVRLGRIAERYENQIDYDLLTYTLGGVTIAAKLDHVKMKPAESMQGRQKVFMQVCADLKLSFDPQDDFYNFLNSQPEDVRKKAFALISKYGNSKEREKPAIEHAEKAFMGSDCVFLSYGIFHDFSDVLDDERKNGDMQEGVALIKIDVRKLKHSGSDKIK